MDLGMKYEDAHVKMLELQNIPHDRNAPAMLYTTEALEAGDKALINQVNSTK